MYAVVVPLFVNVKSFVEFHSIVIVSASASLVNVKLLFAKAFSRLVSCVALVVRIVTVLIVLSFLFSKVKVFNFFNCISPYKFLSHNGHYDKYI